MTSRLLEKPIFILSSVRSGSTLLRVVLGSHSQIFAPPELEVWGLRPTVNSPGTELGLEWAGFGIEDVKNLLWDRMLHVLVQRSGKRFLAEKTPQSVFYWREIAECWEDARFIFLLRHPAQIAMSWYLEEREAPGTPEPWTVDDAITDVVRYLACLQEAMSSLKGLVITYEELTSEPVETTRSICAYLNLPWESRMIRYGRFDHGGPYVPGLGDWGARIESGRILPTSHHETRSDDRLQPFCEAWGYSDSAWSGEPI